MFRAWGLRTQFLLLGLDLCGFVQGLWVRGFRVSVIGLNPQGFGFRVQGFGFGFGGFRV